MALVSRESMKRFAVVARTALDEVDPLLVDHQFLIERRRFAVQKVADHVEGRLLGFIGDLGSGVFYFMARIFDWGGTSISAANADYGTKFLVVAGLLNVMAAVDAYHIAIGKKQ